MRHLQLRLATKTYLLNLSDLFSLDPINTFFTAANSVLVVATSSSHSRIAALTSSNSLLMSSMVTFDFSIMSKNMACEFKFFCWQHCEACEGVRFAAPGSDGSKFFCSFDGSLWHVQITECASWSVLLLSQNVGTGTSFTLIGRSLLCITRSGQIAFY